MKTEEWKAKLMDYLYDEMGPHEKLAFEQELKVNPALQEELNLLKNDQSTLAGLEDESVSAPPFFKVHKKEGSNNSSIGLKWFMAVAASLLILMVAAKFTGLEISNQKGEFRIAFGNPELSETEIDANQIEDLIAKSLAAYDKKIETERVKERQTFKEQLLASQENQKLLVNNYVEALEKKHTQLMQVYWTENTKQQQVYMQNLLTDFAGYMEEQRSEDLNYIIAKLELMETDKELFKLETGEMINALANNTNKTNTY